MKPRTRFRDWQGSKADNKARATQKGWRTFMSGDWAEDRAKGEADN